jgi:cobalt-zinc-cadmium efflux system protein
MLTGWLWLDPAISLVIAAVVLWSGWGLARDSVNLALDGVPRGIELVKVRDYLGGSRVSLKCMTCTSGP